MLKNNLTDHPDCLRTEQLINPSQLSNIAFVKLELFKPNWNNLTKILEFFWSYLIKQN